MAYMQHWGIFDQSEYKYKKKCKLCDNYFGVKSGNGYQALCERCREKNKSKGDDF